MFGAAVFGALLVVGDLIIALGINEPRFARLLMLGLAGLALVLVFRFPFAATCLVLVLVATVLEPGRFKVPFGPIQWRVEELTVGALFLVAVVRPRRAWWGGLPGRALAVFLGILACSAVLALVAGRVSFADDFGYTRLFTSLLLFYVIVRLFPEPDQVRRLLLAAVVLAVITGVVSLAVAAPGSSLAHVLNPNDTAAIRDKEGLGLVNRVRLPGVSLAYVLFWYVAARAIAARRGQHLISWSLALAAMILSLGLSFNRNMWLGVVIGLLIMLVIGRGLSRRRLVAALAVLLAGTLAVGLFGPKLSSNSPLYPIVQRGSTLLHPGQESSDPSLQDRSLENRYAVPMIESHPIIGIGPGALYGVPWPWVHNQYLHLLLIGGPGALLAFLVFLTAPAVAILRRRSRDDGPLALAVGVAITMVSSIVMISFVNATWTAALALLAGAMTVLDPRTAARRPDDPTAPEIHANPLSPRPRLSAAPKALPAATISRAYRPPSA